MGIAMGWWFALGFILGGACVVLLMISISKELIDNTKPPTKD